MDATGTSTAVGRMLRRRLQQLPSLDRDLRQAGQTRAEIDYATERRLDLDDARASLRVLDERADTILAGQITAQQNAAFRQQQLHQLAAQREVLDQLDQTYDRYLTQLTALDSAGHELSAVVRESIGFMKARLLWIPSLPPLKPTDLQALSQALAG